MDTRSLRYETLADEFAGLIDRRVLGPGERLPSVRRLAQEKRLSVSTVLQALRTLEDRGLVEARPQSGFYVRRRAPARAEPEPRRTPARPVRLDISQRIVNVLQLNARAGIVPLGAALPDTALLPIAAIRRLYASVARRQPDLLRSESHCNMNEPALLRQLLRRSLAWGGPLEAEEIVVTNSCTEAMFLCLRAVTKPGDTVAVESPGYYLMLQLLESLGLKALEIPTDPRRGISIDALDLATRDGREGKVKACLLVANASNPLGTILSDTDKKRLARLLESRGVPLIEDDIYGDLQFGERRPWPVKAFDRGGNVMLCASFSKSITPALRCGYVAAGRFATEVMRQKTLASGATNPITQNVLARFLESGAYDRNLRALRRAYREQVERMSDAVSRHFPEGTRITRPQGGLVLWLELPGQTDTSALFDRAAEENIAFVPGDLFSPSGLYRNCLRLNCGNPWTPAIEAGVRRLGELAS
ncbi:MAG: Histidinol-phosphate aminotransferase [Rhodocyclaceae bacterium]|nr:MAG: PLP-dependent aminotransferase family protein [Rhodocyclaceae bacterium]MBV6406484.1 Histidinol-phosphate aminotransferase [Rhodocyclaceae bacterium]CAG0928678.1 2-aminoadipate transaminase [Rhodocyclaceae bacterium]